uniref:Uncharacterized protein n=1 Tax=Chaetoceros debilis TaxID=122233 RepID=A0A7S3Q5P7_9STRA
MLKQSFLFPLFILGQQGGGISLTKASSSLLPSVSIIRSNCRTPTSITRISSSRLHKIRGGSTSNSLLQQIQNQNQTELDNQVIQNGAEPIPPAGAFVDGADVDADADTEMRADDNKDSQSITSQPENLQTSVPDPHPHHHVTPDDSVDIVSTRTRQPFNFIDNISISLALRLTCEINRRLAIGIDAYQHQKSMEHDASHCIFYTHPLKRSPLSSYIDHLFQAFDKKQRHFENVNAVDQAAISSMNLHIRAIALIYLERACSEKTVRQIGIELVQEEQLQGYESNGHGGCGDTVAASPDVTCPHLNPTNVHKLFLAALILASRTYFNELPVPTGIPTMNMRDQITADYARMIQASGDNSVRDLAAVDLANLLEWMAASLGAEGFVVHMEETNSFIDNWRHIFG